MSDPTDLSSPLWTPLVTILYVALWGLPHWADPNPNESWPWVGLVPRAVEMTIGVSEPLFEPPLSVTESHGSRE